VNTHTRSKTQRTIQAPIRSWLLSWEAEEKRRNLEKVRNQKHTEAKILKLEKPVKNIIVNAGNA